MDIKNFLELDDMQFENMVVYQPESQFVKSAFEDREAGFDQEIFLMIDSRFIEKRYLGSFFDWSDSCRLVEKYNIEDWVNAEGFDVCDGVRFRSYLLESDDLHFKQWNWFDKNEFLRKIASLEGLPSVKSPVGDRVFFDKEDLELGQWPKAQIWLSGEVGPKIGMVWFS